MFVCVLLWIMASFADRRRTAGLAELYKHKHAASAYHQFLHVVQSSGRRPRLFGGTACNKYCCRVCRLDLISEPIFWT